MKRTPVWPAYLVAAAAFVIALISSIANISLLGQLNASRDQDVRLSRYAALLARRLADERKTVSDIFDPDARHYPVQYGEVVTRADRVYLVMRDLPQPPRGRVYQAWTRRKGAQTFVPSLTFVPSMQGVAVLALPVDARQTAEVEITIERNGGGRLPAQPPFADAMLGAASAP
jgi:hypothetical protein